MLDVRGIGVKARGRGARWDEAGATCVADRGEVGESVGEKEVVDRLLAADDDDLTVREPGEVPQLDDGPQPLGQLLDGAANRRELIGAEPFVRGEALGAERLAPRSTFRASPAVARDRRQPRGERTESAGGGRWRRPKKTSWQRSAASSSWPASRKATLQTCAWQARTTAASRRRVGRRR